MTGASDMVVRATGPSSRCCNRRFSSKPYTVPSNVVSLFFLLSVYNMREACHNDLEVGLLVYYCGVTKTGIVSFCTRGHTVFGTMILTVVQLQNILHLTKKSCPPVLVLARARRIARPVIRPNKPPLRPSLRPCHSPRQTGSWNWIREMNSSSAIEI